ncbi:ParM/StbA family protein [Metabacillus bambusae]|uniref:ParM/StbA family protein n=1 Tax=Metabacillus bambusae TaxID=2795218 RepID=A0ABS3NBQ8_9BACI|nr:ParM/StbA family protein [Metabacillus bambusae]MBO1515658.1 ParM/StbA family protein [Metabacillus bambusae]
MILGIDAGNYETKISTQEGVHKFRSLLGEWRDRNFNSVYGNDMEYVYQGRMGFAGDIVEHECEFIRERFGDTKAHEDAKLRILLAVHQYSNDKENDIVVGQPIKTHTPDQKETIKKMLIGSHKLTVNGETKTFNIRNIDVAPEGAIAYWAYEGLEQHIRFIDIGSGTINFASVHKGRFVDRDSFTVDYGVNSVKALDFNSLAAAIIAESSKRWKQDDPVRVCGGVAEEVINNLSTHYRNCEVIKPWDLHPVYTNAIGCFELARVLYERK